MSKPEANNPPATQDARKQQTAQVMKEETAKPAIPKAPPWYRTLRADPPLQIRLAIAGGFLAMLLFMWWFVTRGSATDAIISPSKVPSPGAVFSSFSKLQDRGLGDAIVATLARVLQGVGLAAIIGIILGVAAGSLRSVAAALGPVVIFLRSIPMGAMLPLMLVLFSTGEKQKVMFIFFAVVPFVFSDTMKAVASVPERFVETAKTLGASNSQILRKVLVPLALPDIITSLRFQFGLALGYVMLAEAIDTPHGIGRMLGDGERRGLIENNYLLLFIIAMLAFVIDLIIRTLQRGAFPYRKDL